MCVIMRACEFVGVWVGLYLSVSIKMCVIVLACESVGVGVGDWCAYVCRPL
jgi:hypothetical protein